MGREQKLLDTSFLSYAAAGFLGLEPGYGPLRPALAGSN